MKTGPSHETYSPSRSTQGTFLLSGAAGMQLLPSRLQTAGAPMDSAQRTKRTSLPNSLNSVYFKQIYP